ncbi:hypothetical protein [Coleofasciculus sp. F4-SAH-05]|uniref:hypothetical protein n=1 Tax=Coleofasciculus sp. F4-SAH-05 TaxID=3069525 RepID=UPI0032FA198D
MLTELQTKKWTRLFQVYDADGNGTITQEDFELIFQNLAKFRNLEANTPQYDQLHTKYMEGWELVKKMQTKITMVKSSLRSG